MTLMVLWFLTTFGTSSSEGDQKGQQPPEGWQGYSLTFHLLLPLAGIFILWGRRDLLNKLLLHVDRNCISVFCPSLSKRQNLLKWAIENLPTSWSSSSRTLSGGIPDLWKDGSLLCTLINMAIPGACQNPPKHWKKPPTHAQALAYKYLGITPVFRESEFKDPFTPNQERKFLTYLQDLQHAIKLRGDRESDPKFSQNYIAKGMGLHNGEQYKKTAFYVYSNSKNTNCSNILVYIRGPYGTQGTATIPAFYNLNTTSILSCLHKQNRSMDTIAFKKEARKSFLKSIALDFSSLMNFDRKSVLNNIPIHVDIETNRAKISYIPLNYGIYEVNLITNGEMLANSPFAVSISKNSVGTKDYFDTTERVLQELPSLKKRTVVARFIDCIDEKIPLDKDDTGASSASEESGNGSQFIFDGIEATASPSTPKLSKSVQDMNSKLRDTDIKEKQSVGCTQKSVKFAKKDIQRLLPILSVTEPDENESEGKEDYCKLQLSSSKIVNDCNINPTTPNDSLEIPKSGEGVVDDNIVEATRLEQSSLLATPPRDTFIMSSEDIDNTHSSYISHSSPQSQSKPKTSRDAEEINLSTDPTDVASESAKILDLIKPDWDLPLTEDHTQKRPTSIVTPFLINLNSGEKPHERSFVQIDENQELGLEKKAVIEIEKQMDYVDNNKYNPEIYDSNIIEESWNPRTRTLAKNGLENSYVERLKAILLSKLTESENTKTIKNLVNTSNKLKIMNKIPFKQDENNNAFQENSLRDASPICPAHIVPEVDPNLTSKTETAPVSEKRKLFTRQSCLSISSSTNSSFSEKENEDVANELSEKCSLRLLSVIDTIRNSTNSSLTRSISSSTPNISISKSSTGSSSGGSKSSFLEAREYWLGLSSENFSDYDSPRHKIKAKRLEIPMKNSSEKYKSAEDITSISRMNFSRRLKKYSSLNQKDFEAIEFISLEERKKMLLQDQYENEKMMTKFVSKNFSARTSADMNCKTQKGSGYVEKITGFSIKAKPPGISVQNIELPQNGPANEHTSTSQFKRAINFFKNLEKSAHHKKKLPLKPKPEIKRRFSLDFLERKRDRSKLGGSLRIPKSSEQFSMTRIYFDVVTNKRGSFKGASNREALSETLASLSSRTDELLDKSEGPIQYNMFNKAKSKKRKSLKSIFNIHY